MGKEDVTVHGFFRGGLVKTWASNATTFPRWKIVRSLRWLILFGKTKRSRNSYQDGGFYSIRRARALSPRMG